MNPVAIEWARGSKAWFLNGVLHRTDGPAYEDVDGSKVTLGPVKKLPLYMNMGFDEFISERLKT